MNVVYPSSDVYARHAGESITSLFEENKSVEMLNVFVIEYNISTKNKERLNCIHINMAVISNIFPLNAFLT